MESTSEPTQLQMAQARFHHARKQMVLLNNQIVFLKERYQRAVCDQRLSLQCSLQLRLTSYEGVRNMLYEYANQKLEEMKELSSLCETDEEYSSEEED